MTDVKETINKMDLTTATGILNFKQDEQQDVQSNSHFEIPRTFV